VRQRFASPPLWQPETRGDGRLFEGRERAAASVLVPLVERDGGLTVLLTQRTAHLRDHAGQISFPGGRAESTDADAVATALREAEEEVGLARQHIDVIGSLPEYRTVTYYDVTPVVALVRPPFELVLDTHEVADAFEVPLTFLMTPANHQRHRFEFAGYQREFLSMPWPRPGGVEPYFIWGATAAMLRNLYRLLSA
jgi:8-oxo-dGTP pyrophosphatase MutT (NUDIX family)